MLCDLSQGLVCPDTVCGNLTFSVCKFSFASENDGGVYDGCGDTSRLNCDDKALETCTGLWKYVNNFGLNDSLPLANQTTVCQRTDELHLLPTAISSPISQPTQESAAIINHSNFILALMFICLLTVSLSRKI